MGAVALSALVLFVALSVYKKISMKNKSPVDDAVEYFLEKNKLDGFGAVDLLIGLLVVSVLVIAAMNFTGSGMTTPGGSSLNTKDAKQQADKMSEEIQQIRQTQQLPEN
jgi:hypothetical protein